MKVFSLENFPLYGMFYGTVVDRINFVNLSEFELGSTMHRYYSLLIFIA